MGLLFLLLLISAGITYLSHAWTENNNNKRENCVAGAIISSALTAVVFIIIWAGSYVSFLEMEKNLATIEQYSSAVKLYAEKGVAEFKPGSGQPSEFTDHHGFRTIIVFDLLNNSSSQYGRLPGLVPQNHSWPCFLCH